MWEISCHFPSQLFPNQQIFFGYRQKLFSRLLNYNLATYDSENLTDVTSRLYTQCRPVETWTKSFERPTWNGGTRRLEPWWKLLHMRGARELSASLVMSSALIWLCTGARRMNVIVTHLYSLETFWLSVEIAGAFFSKSLEQNSSRFLEDVWIGKSMFVSKNSCEFCVEIMQLHFGAERNLRFFAFSLHFEFVASTCDTIYMSYLWKYETCPRSVRSGVWLWKTWSGDLLRKQAFLQIAAEETARQGANENLLCYIQSCKSCTRYI